MKYDFRDRIFCRQASDVSNKKEYKIFLFILAHSKLNPTEYADFKKYPMLSSAFNTFCDNIKYSMGGAV